MEKSKIASILQSRQTYSRVAQPVFLSVYFRTVILILIAFFVYHVSAGESESPEITAQGFNISITQEGILHDFGQLRVRFEVPKGIEELHVKERSYDVDLAKTPEISHFEFFDLKTQVRRMTDVTLNFQNYINKKIDSDGEYVIDLRVIDRKGNSASSELKLRVNPIITTREKMEEKALKQNHFRFQRVGKSNPTGVEIFGITWKTVDGDNVAIEISGTENNSSRLIKVNSLSYSQVRTKANLHQTISLGEEIPALLLVTANNMAAGSVFGILNNDKLYLLKVTESGTTVSTTGTTVTLTGEYKY